MVTIEKTRVFREQRCKEVCVQSEERNRQQARARKAKQRRGSKNNVAAAS